MTSGLCFCPGVIQLRRLAPRGHKSTCPKRQKAPFRPVRHMLVGSEQAASAFGVIQLRRLEARGHKLNLPKRQRTPFRQVHLMLVASGRAASAFVGNATAFHK